MNCHKRDLTRKVKLTLSQMKDGKAPEKDRLTIEKINLSWNTTIETMRLVLNTCLFEGSTPKTLENDLIVLLYNLAI